MGGIIVFSIIILFVVISIVAKSSSVNSLDRLAARGIRARALVLASSNIAVGTTINGRRFQRRVMTIEVEIPGRPPYVIAQGTFLIPRGLVEPLPGSSLDLAVDPRNPSNVAVLGPGGFTGPWLNVGPPQPF